MRLTMLYRVMLLIIAGLVMGALMAPISQATAQPQPEVQFYGSGVGRVRLEPDYAIVVFAVQAISKTAQGAIAENAKSVEALLRQLRAHIQPGDRIETAGFHLGPGYGGFVVVNRVQVRTTRVKDVGGLIDLGVRAGADDVSSVGFGREHTKEAAQQAVREAMQRARENAEAVAAGLGMRVLRIMSIEPSLEQIEGPMVFNQAALRSGAADATQIQPGALTLTAQVRIHFVLGP
jgi:uncharacterized protein YggE